MNRIRTVSPKYLKLHEIGDTEPQKDETPFGPEPYLESQKNIAKVADTYSTSRVMYSTDNKQMLTISA